MKAKEYGVKFINDLDAIKSEEEVKKLFETILKAFLNEGMELCKTRHSTSNSCVLGVLKEQIQKWYAFATHVNKHYDALLIKENGFKLYLLDVNPKLTGKL